MKVYFNTKAFDCLPGKKKLDITEDVFEADLAVLGGKTIDFPRLKNLKAVYRFGVGRENIPEAVIEKGSPEVFFPGENTRKELKAWSYLLLNQKK